METYIIVAIGFSVIALCIVIFIALLPTFLNSEKKSKTRKKEKRDITF